ncbi:hypothetical protein H2198_000925 [Neophaeococcomyces mojaviensis]|uniref:Uncharacterized protein n=1 Tax=Neophaeococcomyces mojaviensis TaxID=3383035 RepID=A0ACC3AIC5_9EURO|nr:hypothetical protein H2198_000925 [Knufia sp. JES_112]
MFRKHAAHVDPRNKERRREEKEKRVNDLQGEVNRLEAILGIFQLGDDDEALRALQEFRSAGKEHNVDPQPPRLSEELFAKLSVEINGRQGDPKSHSSDFYGPSNLPPAAVVHKGANFFFDVIAGLCYVMTKDDFEALFQRVYSGGRVDPVDVIELCAVAAAGSQFLEDQSSETRDTMLMTAIQGVNQVIAVSDIRSLVVIFCVCIYGMLEKRRTSRDLVHLGLEMCRQPQANDSSDPEASTKRMKLCRSIMFLECWLSTSLGYQPDLRDDEIRSVMTASHPSSDTITDNSTQAKAMQIGLLKTKALQVSYGRRPPTVSIIETHMQDLDRWHSGLPPFLTLDALMSGNSMPLTTSQRGAVFLAHALWLGTVILLHHQVLVATADANALGHWLLEDIDRAQAEIYHMRCVDAARSITRIFILLGFGTKDSGMNIRCWLSNFEIFTACAVLLYSIALRISLHRFDGVALAEDLERANRCVQMLNAAGRIDRVSEKLHDILVKMYQTLATLHESTWKFDDYFSGLPRPQGCQQIMAASMAHGTVYATRSGDKICPCLIAEELVKEGANILRNPFGHEKTVSPALHTRGSDWQSADWWEFPD